MALPIRLFVISVCLKNARTESIVLPMFLMNDQSLLSTNTTTTTAAMSTSVYLCHVHEMKNSQDFFLQGYNIINGENIGRVHHLLVYECSIKENLTYSGLCGIHNARLMPTSVYRHCQTRILIAWAQGSQLRYNYPINTGLKITSHTRVLLEVHFEPSIPYNQTIGIHLRFYPLKQHPKYEIGMITLGTLPISPIYLPPGLNTIRFPTYCFNDCLRLHLKNNSIINIFSVLVHAHRHANRIVIETNDFIRLVDRNPFEFHRQESIYFNEPYPQIDSTHEISLICYYSTINEYSDAIYGGYDSNNEMCQAFLYYYPKIDSFPLCLSIPSYPNKYLINQNHKWTYQLSAYIKYQLESNIRHIPICGDHIDDDWNQSIVQTKVYVRTMENVQPDYYSNMNFSSIIYSIMIFFLLMFIVYGYVFVKKNLAFFF